MALNKASKHADEQEHFFTDVNADLEAELSRYKEDLEKAQEDLRKKNYHLQSLKAGLSYAGGGDGGAFDSDALQKLLKLASGREEPSPLDCIEMHRSGL